MRVLVCGGRDYADYEYLQRQLFKVHNIVAITEVVHGAARGADRMADQWAKWRNIPVRAFPADWSRLGAAAGPTRNQQMIDEARPDLVIAFPGGKGTADMCNRARACGIRVLDLRNRHCE